MFFNFIFFAINKPLLSFGYTFKLSNVNIPSPVHLSIFKELVTNILELLSVASLSLKYRGSIVSIEFKVLLKLTTPSKLYFGCFFNSLSKFLIISLLKIFKISPLLYNPAFAIVNFGLVTIGPSSTLI